MTDPITEGGTLIDERVGVLEMIAAERRFQDQLAPAFVALPTSPAALMVEVGQLAQAMAKLDMTLPREGADADCELLDLVVDHAVRSAVVCVRIAEHWIPKRDEELGRLLQHVRALVAP